MNSPQILSPSNRIMSVGGPSIAGGPLDSAEPWYLSGGISAANCVAAYQPKGAASLAASYTNLANPGTYTAAPGVAPTWGGVTGWTFNGTSQHLVTGVVPDVTSQTWSMVVKFSGAGDGVFSGINGTNKRFFIYNVSTINYSHGSSAATSSSGSSLVTGVLAIGGRSCYRNGFFQTTIPLGAGASSAMGLYIGASNDGVAANTFYPGSIQSVSFYNFTLSAAQVLAVTTAMNAL